MRKFLLAVGLIVFCADAALACDMPWMPFSAKARSWMKVQSGKPCEIWFRSSGPTHSVQITKRPAHGTVSIGSVNKVIYQSRPGYTGADSFTYVYSGRTSRNVPRRSVVTFAVTVTP
jgi:hypothetical protein